MLRYSGRSILWGFRLGEGVDYDESSLAGFYFVSEGGAGGVGGV